MYLPKDLMEEDMKKLPFVNWDRFILKKRSVELFGWIKREDTHEDFVFIEYQLKDDVWYMSFSTSSAEKTKEIHKLLECEGGHKDCQRVENNFDVENCVRLKK